MSRLKYLVPAAALLLASAVMAVPAQAAPVATPDALAARSVGGSGVDQVHWRRWHHEHHDHWYWHWRHHRHHHHHHHGDRHHRRDHHQHQNQHRQHHRSDRHR